MIFVGKSTAAALAKVGIRTIGDLAGADVDGDGSITSTDARLILQYYAGKITAWP